MEMLIQSLENSSYAVASIGVDKPRARGGGGNGLPLVETPTSRSFTGNVNVGSLSWKHEQHHAATREEAATKHAIVKTRDQ